MAADEGRAQAHSYSPAFLYRVIEVIGSGPDLATILHRFIPLVTAATECHGCFIYFVEDSSLVMRAASPAYSHMEGKVRFGPDQGLTGWVARTRRSAYIKDKALEDPRTVFVPELEEEQYQSLVAVPILSRAGEVIGVITLHARAPHEFREQDLSFLEHAASLIAGAIENARLYEEAVARVEQLTELSALAQQVASAATSEELLSSVTQGCRRLLGASRCDLFLAGPDDRLEPAMASPPHQDASPLDASHLWSEVMAAGEEPGGGRQLANLVWGKLVEGSPLFAPLSTGDERVGLLCALVERPTRDHRSLLASVAAYAAVAVKRRQLIESLEEKNLVKDFFEALAGGRTDIERLRAQAARLQFDLEAQYLVLQAVPAEPGGTRAGPRDEAPRPTDQVQFADRLEARLRLELPKSIFDRGDNFLRGLLRVPAAGPEAAVAAVRRVYEALARPTERALSVGISNPSRDPGSIFRGFEEAASASQIGPLLRGRPGVYAYEDLGAYRYVVSAEGTVRDRYQDRLQKLVEHQERRGTDLLRTLEAYVEHHGSIAQTSRALYLHPNTLRQRLARIEELARLELEHEDWLSLGMAIKIVKLRSIRGPNAPHLPDC